MGSDGEAELLAGEAEAGLAEREAGEASAQRAIDGLIESPGPIESPDAPPQVPVDLTAAAFFDVDNTLVQGSSLVHFGRGLAARKYFRYSEVWKLSLIHI